jgi:hypothetical protein
VQSQKFQIYGWDVEHAGSQHNPDCLALQHCGILRLKLLLQNSKTAITATLWHFEAQTTIAE